MAYTKYSLTPSSNTAAPPDGAPEGMLPSAVNDTMRDMMAQIRDCGDGIRGGTYTMTAPIITGGTINGATIGATTASTGKFTAVTNSALTSGRVTYAGTAGVLQDDADFTFNGTTVTMANDASISGLTVGKGGGAVSSNTAVGASALNANTSGASNTAVGDSSSVSTTTGTQNTSVGRFSLRFNTTGGNNVAVGSTALYTNTTGGSNTALGTDALQLNTTASNNTAVGYQAAYSNVTGTRVTAYGTQALYSNTGNDSVAVGYQALYANTSGVGNVAVGYALPANTTGGSNVAIGVSSLQSNTTASFNVAVGYSALQSNTTASNNTAVGYQAGYSITTGAQNTLVGKEAGRGITTGSYNAFFGVGDSSNQGAGYLVTTGAYNTIIGGFSGNQGGLDIRTGNNNIVLSDGAGTPMLQITGNNAYFTVPSAYSATTASGANMNVAATGFIARSTSALKYKQDIRDLPSIDINKFRPVVYKSKCEKDDQTKDHFGVIADEVHDAGITELVNYGAEGEVEGFQYERLTVVLLKELQDLKKTVEAQALEIATLKGN